ncbi:MAG: rhomboid family intramembrane serine protease [Planctomycetaceae bacterium]
MREIGTLPEQDQAERFRDWLTTRDMVCEVDCEDETWVIWIHDEDRLESAAAELRDFQADPRAERYLAAATAARQQRRAEQQRHTRSRPRSRPARTWARTPWQRCPATITLMALSVLLTLICVRGLKSGSLDFDMAIEPVMDKLTIVTVEQRDDGMYVPTYNFARAWDQFWNSIGQGTLPVIPEHGVGKIARGQLWRLVTPIFLHFSILHILFNLLWVKEFGGAIELRRGKVRFLLLVLLISVVSNVGQYWTTGHPVFGGLSGVVYGLFGYLWIKERYDPDAGLTLPPGCAVWMIGWFLICWTGIVGNIANGAHAFGLATGMLVGMLPTRNRFAP